MQETNPPWSAANQERRRMTLYRKHCQAVLPLVFHADGTRKAGLVGDPREAAWHAFAPFAVGAAGDAAMLALANGILRHTTWSPSYDFGMSGLLGVYARHRAVMEPDVLAAAEAAIAACGEHQCEGVGFVGMNDNFGAMEIMVLCLAGTYTGRPALIANAITKMQGLVGRLNSHGTITEFNSPTYSTITMTCMADIATYCTDPTAAALALRIEQQLSYDLAARFHPGSLQVAGPSSRSYMAESCGHMHNARWTYAAAFGLGMDYLLEHSYNQGNDLVLHHGHPAFIPCNGAWLASPTFHITDACGALATARPLPYTAVGTASLGLHWRPDEWQVHPTGRATERYRKFQPMRWAPALLTTHMTAAWSLGSSAGAHMCGSGSQHEAFFASWRRTPVDGAEPTPAEIRTAFCRYVFDDAMPARTLSLLPDQGRKTALQKDGIAMVLYRPDITRLSHITGMRLCVVLPLFRSRPDELWIGDTQLPDLATAQRDGARTPGGATLLGESAAPATVFVRDGEIAIAFRPLMLDDYGRRVAVDVALADEGHFLTVNFYNYQGPARSLNFPYEAAPYTQNGFVCEIATVADAGGFAAFRARVAAATLSDAFAADGIRVARYARPGVDLLLHHDPQDEGVISPAWIDGAPRKHPHWLSSDGTVLPE